MKKKKNEPGQINYLTVMSRRKDDYRNDAQFDLRLSWVPLLFSCKEKAFNVQTRIVTKLSVKKIPNTVIEVL